ncbi:toll/interleukin-1 receptor domain-containing protein [Desulfoluna spongiiphila]|uniref:toll/interleukin-1 receptor domain-containing protein n=1 Tax=Desulfoluna spongiiphila TaxID=419481 RepID=UPI000B89C155|nr:toll/interleukin-1 receptor domain-containing protein [Desulfoluna spongiiphila]
MNKVFISYSLSDLEIASSLHTELEGIEVAGLLDQSDITAGDAISAKVKESLHQASALIVLVSQSSIKSKWVQFEIGAAYAMEKQIIAIITGSTHTELNLPEWLMGFMYIDARNQSMQEVARKIEKALNDGK